MRHVLAYGSPAGAADEQMLQLANRFHLAGALARAGGVMDRLDGFWAATVAGCVVGLFRGGFDEPARGLLIW